MREVAPCKDCTDRHTACHDSCEKYKEWKARHLAQQNHLRDHNGLWCVPLTPAREKAYASYRPGHRQYTTGGEYE